MHSKQITLLHMSHDVHGVLYYLVGCFIFLHMKDSISIYHNKCTDFVSVINILCALFTLFYHYYYKKLAINSFAYLKYKRINLIFLLLNLFTLHIKMLDYDLDIHTNNQIIYWTLFMMTVTLALSECVMTKFNEKVTLFFV